MANYVGAITNFNPYIQQIPTEAMVKVGMYKEQQYEAGIQKIQGTVDTIAGLDIANEGGRNYLRDRVDELTSKLNKYSQVDFSDASKVSQLVGLSKPIFQDENIIADVTNTSVYRNWAKKAGDALESGSMELGQYAREMGDAAGWLNSQQAGAKYTGRSNPNLATKKDLMDRIVKYKKDAIDQDVFVYDQGYNDPTRPYYNKIEKRRFSEAEFQNWVMENVMSSQDREMLMNDHWYQSGGVPTEDLLKESLMIYSSRIESNNKEIKYLEAQVATASDEEKKDLENTAYALQSYNQQLIDGKMKHLMEMDLSDPKNRDLLHQDLAEHRFLRGLDVLLNSTDKQEVVYNKAWEKWQDLLHNAAKSGKGGDETTKKNPYEAIEEVSFYSPVAGDGPKTKVNLGVIQNGYEMADQEIMQGMNNILNVLEKEGVDLSPYIRGWRQTNVGLAGGGQMSVPEFTPGGQEGLYKLIHGLNFAYEKEGRTANRDKVGFAEWVAKELPQYNDEDPNSKFDLKDKVLSESLNALKGSSALLPKLEKIFSKPGVIDAMAQIDESLKRREDMGNAYRAALLSSGALSAEEMRLVKSLPTEDLVRGGVVDKRKRNEELKKKYGEKAGLDYEVKKGEDGNYYVVEKAYQNSIISSKTGKIHFDGLIEENTLPGKFYSKSEANEAISTGMFSSYLPSSTLKRANEIIEKTFSFVQEDVNTTVANLKKNKEAYQAVKDGIQLFMIKALRSGTAAGGYAFKVDRMEDFSQISGVTDVEVLGASINNTEDIFNPNPVYEVSFKYVDSEGKDRAATGTVSLKSFLDTNPNFKTSEYASYFAPMLYAKDDAYERIKARVNPLEGAEGSYGNRKDIKPVYSITNARGENRFIYDDLETQEYPNTFGREIQWHTVPIKRGEETSMISYRIFSLGQEGGGGRGSMLYGEKGNEFQKGAFYVQMKIAGSDGRQRVVTLRKNDKTPVVFQSASFAKYALQDLILNNPDVSLEDIDQNTKKPNYLTTNPNTLRGILNMQLHLEGYSKLELEEIKNAYQQTESRYKASELQAVN